MLDFNRDVALQPKIVDINPESLKELVRRFGESLRARMEGCKKLVSYQEKPEEDEEATKAKEEMKDILRAFEETRGRVCKETA